MEARIKEGHFDKLFCFQLFIDEFEFMSNRPSFPMSTLYRFTMEAEAVPFLEGAAYYIKSKFKWLFNVPKTGKITLRLLPPLDGTRSYDVLYFWVFPQVLGFKNVDDIVGLESAFATRKINYTGKFDTTLKLTSTADTSVKNNISHSKIILGIFIRSRRNTTAIIVCR